MKKLFLTALLAAMLIGGIAPGLLKAQPANDAIEVEFSPHQGATDSVVHLIQEARSSIRVAAYSFTSKDIAAALVAAHRKHIDVQVVLDKSNETGRYSSATFLENEGVPLRIDHHYAIMHSKYMVVDGKTVETSCHCVASGEFGIQIEPFVNG